LSQKRGNYTNKALLRKRSINRLSNSNENYPLRVLHVDDDLNQLYFTKLFLEECDSRLSVESIMHPLVAMKVLLEKKYDCLVSDYQMDEMDGIALTRRVRGESDVPIIIYTGRGSEEVEEVARAAGANRYVQKETDPKHYRGLYNQICGVVREKMSG
jgi:CheY-like chemotaxis protein